jgi:hypothetical protein
MEQRATIQERIGEYVLKISKPPRIPAQQGGAARANPDKFYPAWEEACRAQYGGEHRRAHYFYHQALTAAPEDVEAEALADIFDSLKEVNRILAQEEGRLPGLRAAVENDPADSETRLKRRRRRSLKRCWSTPRRSAKTACGTAGTTSDGRSTGSKSMPGQSRGLSGRPKSKA